MEHVVVTLEVDGRTEDLALPLEVPLREVIPAVVKALDLPSGRHVTYGIALKRKGEDYKPLRAEDTLWDVGVRHGMTLLLLAKQRIYEEVSTRAILKIGRKEILLDKDSMILGRSVPSKGFVADINLGAYAREPRLLSRRHARIFREKGFFFVEDLGSGNGTYLNEKRLQPHRKYPLEDGDVIVFGKGTVEAVFHCIGC